MKRFLLTILLIILVFMLVIHLIPMNKIPGENKLIIEKDQPLVIAHRGGKDLWPENTIPAFDSAIAIGADMLEMDVVLTKDSIPVVIHDDSIDRVSNGKGKVRDFYLKDLSKYDFSHHFKNYKGKNPYSNAIISIPTLEEVLQRYRGVPKSIEIKDTGKRGRTSARSIKDFHDKYLCGDLVVISSFDDATIKYFRKIMQGKLYTTAATKESGKFSVFSMLFLDPLIYPRYEAYHLPFEYKNFNLGRKRIVKAAHRSNTAMHYWTINDSVRMIELLDIGADGIITDRPDILINILKDKKNQTLK